MEDTPQTAECQATGPRLIVRWRPYSQPTIENESGDVLARCGDDVDAVELGSVLSFYGALVQRGNVEIRRSTFGSDARGRIVDVLLAFDGVFDGTFGVLAAVIRRSVSHTRAVARELVELGLLEISDSEHEIRGRHRFELMSRVVGELEGDWT